MADTGQVSRATAQPDPLRRPSNFHRQRRAAMLAQQPQIKQLFGHCPWVGLLAVVLVVAQFGLAAGLARAPVWATLLAAVLVGAFIMHCLNAIIHDATHNLVLRTTAANKSMGIIANLPGVVPSAIAFRYFHRMHHRFLGERGNDPDLPLRWEARLVGASPIRKLAWLLLMPLNYGVLHPLQVRKRLPIDRWFVLNVLAVSGSAVCVVVLLGWSSFLYLAFSVYFSVGPHPTGAHILQEHINFGGRSYETASYYGPINAVSINLGHHFEHHDFVGVPGPRLAQIRRLAPEFYSGRYNHLSRLTALRQFIFDRRLTLANRVITEPIG